MLTVLEFNICLLLNYSTYLHETGIVFASITPSGDLHKQKTLEAVLLKTAGRYFPNGKEIEEKQDLE